MSSASLLPIIEEIWGFECNLNAKKRLLYDLTRKPSPGCTG